jgi:hypothetical protein
MAEWTGWPKCVREECIGIQVPDGQMCLAHASDGEQEAALRAINESGVVDARGVSFSEALLATVLDALPRDDKGKAVFKVARFERATFSGDAEFAADPGFIDEPGFAGVTFGDAWFNWATFSGDARFNGVAFTGAARFADAAFSGAVRFDDAAFSSDAVFSRATFSGAAGFLKATFSGAARFADAAFSGAAGFSDAAFTGAAVFNDAAFSGAAEFLKATFSGYAEFLRAAFSGDATFVAAAFSGDTRFERATFSGDAKFDGATFSSDADFSYAAFSGAAGFSDAAFSGAAGFSGATFSNLAGFLRTTFSGDAWFGDVAFGGAADFAGAAFRGRAEFSNTGFERAREFGPLLAYRGLVLDDADFMQQVRIEVSATGVCCRRARFPAGVQFRLRWARVVLDDTDFPAPSLLSGVPRLAYEDLRLPSEVLTARDERIARAWRRLLGGEISEQPQLLSLRRANVAGLGLSNVTLADCRFAGAHNLDMLRLEASVAFAAAPAPLGRLSWEGRQVIAEERAWRACRRHRWGWSAPSWPGWAGDPPGVLDAGQIAGLYRALRKGREDTKDEPGAADFYYGEMEMRRRTRQITETASRGRAERGLLTAYWLVSGYSLRVWRALAWLTMITALFAVAFHLVGFAKPPQPVSYWTSLLYAFRATLSLTDSNIQLTAWGQLLQGLLRLTGPVLLGFALLALRGRVKR